MKKAHFDPLEFILADHRRQRVVSFELEKLADQSEPDKTLAQSLLEHLEEELPLHFGDEERDLFPLLRKRAQDGDELEATLAQLSGEHEEADALLKGATGALRKIISNEAPDKQDRAALKAFADHNRRHMILENAVVVPLARLRLQEPDLLLFARQIARRRGKSLSANFP